MSSMHEQHDWQADYEYLRDVIIKELDPPDDDIAEVEILADAIRGMRAKADNIQALLAEIVRLRSAFQYIADGNISPAVTFARRTLMGFNAGPLPVLGEGDES